MAVPRKESEYVATLWAGLAVIARMGRQPEAAEFARGILKTVEPYEDRARARAERRVERKIAMAEGR